MTEKRQINVNTMIVLVVILLIGSSYAAIWAMRQGNSIAGYEETVRTHMAGICGNNAECVATMENAAATYVIAKSILWGLQIFIMFLGNVSVMFFCLFYIRAKQNQR